MVEIWKERCIIDSTPLSSCHSVVKVQGSLSSYTVTQRPAHIHVRKSCLANVTYTPALHSTVSLSHGFKGVLVPCKFCSHGQSLSALQDNMELE